MSKAKYHRRKSRKFRKSRKNKTRRHYPSYKRHLVKRYLARGLTPMTPVSIETTTKLPCCICDNQFSRNTMYVPLVCLQKHRERAHRICQDCWWDPQIGFAREDTPHGCPGCKRGLPLNHPIKTKIPSTDEIIVLSD